MQTEPDVTLTGSGHPARRKPVSKAGKSGGRTAAVSSVAATQSQRASAVDDATVRDNKPNQIVVINSTIVRIGQWFGPVTKRLIEVPDEAGGESTTRVAMLLPAGLTLCSKCNRIKQTDADCTACEQ